MSSTTDPSSKLPLSWKVKFSKILRHGDGPWEGLVGIMAVLVLVIILAVGALLWFSSSNSRAAFGFGFLFPTADPHWNPVTDKFDAWPFIYGTLITSIIAMIIAVPMGVGIAIFLAELCPAWLRTPLSWLIELLAAIPSVVYGLWGIFVFLPSVAAPLADTLFKILGEISWLPFFSGPPSASGASRLAAGIILGVMVIPTIASVTRDVFLAIPNSQREASLALGSTRWEMIWQVLIPYGLSGILGAVILGLGRALGETMAVTMVIGNSIEGSLSILRPGYTMASIIANEFAEAVSLLHSEALIQIGLVLFALTLLLNVFARLLVWQVARKVPTEARA
jgi:phosphate transport system permease protein